MYIKISYKYKTFFYVYVINCILYDMVYGMVYGMVYDMIWYILFIQQEKMPS